MLTRQLTRPWIVLRQSPMPRRRPHGRGKGRAAPWMHVCANPTNPA